MRNETRLLYTAYVSQIALLSGVASATDQFTVAPAVQQKLVEVQQAQSDFLSRINVITVPEQEGDKVGVGVTRTIAGRTNTAAGIAIYRRAEKLGLRRPGSRGRRRAHA